jgi:hypothetical protein
MPGIEGRFDSFGIDVKGHRHFVTPLDHKTVEDLITYWTGHAEKSATDGYSKLKEDVAFRNACTEEVGLGFKIPGLGCDVVRNAPKEEVAVLEESIA